MRRVTLRGLAQRKLRAFVTTLAVFLGVAFIAGGYVLTDTINASFDDIFDEALAGTDVSVSPSTRGQADDGSVPPFPAEFLERVRRVEGVESAEGGAPAPRQEAGASSGQWRRGACPERSEGTRRPPTRA